MQRVRQCPPGSGWGMRASYTPPAQPLVRSQAWEVFPAQDAGLLKNYGRIPFRQQPPTERYLAPKGHHRGAGQAATFHIEAKTGPTCG